MVRRGSVGQFSVPHKTPAMIRTARLDRPVRRPYPLGMGDAPDIHALSERLAVLEERMNTHQATYEKALERFERRMADRDAALSERIATAADRNATARWWQTGAILAGIAVAVAVIIAAF
ncbi:MAG: hypothetical protein OXE82_06910, partial [Rhodobacter sp.]|nr:hypothetical protein [Rhodobacter sp.]